MNTMINQILPILGRKLFWGLPSKEKGKSMKYMHKTSVSAGHGTIRKKNLIKHNDMPIHVNKPILNICTICWISINQSFDKSQERPTIIQFVMLNYKLFRLMWKNQQLLLILVSNSFWCAWKFWYAMYYTMICILC